MGNNVCPFCGSDKCISRIINESYTYFECSGPNNGAYIGAYIGNTVLESDPATQRKLFNLIYEYVLNKPMCGDQNWRFFYQTDYKLNEQDEEYYVNLADIPYPSSLSEKADRVLINLYKLFPEYSDEIINAYTPFRAVFSNSEEEDNWLGFLSILCDLGYLKETNRETYKISSKGLQRIEELSRDGNTLIQGFIAMSFDKELTYIAEAIKTAIKESNYFPMIINEKEHNNQIVPEIMHEIDNSRFLVMDVTKQNFGAYYEAGYALGKGKQVIVCCKKEVFDNSESKPHFDIAQKSIVVWNDEKDLVEKLKKRIRATVK